MGGIDNQCTLVRDARQGGLALVFSVVSTRATSHESSDSGHTGCSEHPLKYPESRQQAQEQANITEGDRNLTKKSQSPKLGKLKRKLSGGVDEMLKRIMMARTMYLAYQKHSSRQQRREHSVPSVVYLQNVEQVW